MTYILNDPERTRYIIGSDAEYKHRTIESRVFYLDPFFQAVVREHHAEQENENHGLLKEEKGNGQENRARHEALERLVIIVDQKEIYRQEASQRLRDVGPYLYRLHEKGAYCRREYNARDGDFPPSENPLRN